MLNPSVSLVLLAAAALLGLSSCATGISPKPLNTKVIVLPPSAFGTPEMAQPLLGPGRSDTQVVVHYAQSPEALARHYPGAGCRFVSVVQALRHLNSSIATLPRDQAHAATYATLDATRDTLMDFYNTRRAAYNSVPPYNGRGFFVRTAQIPAIGTTSWRVEQ